MCYDVASRTKAELRYAKLRGGDEAQIEQLKRKLELIEGKPLFHVSGFAHPKLLVFTNEKPHEPQMFTWGLIPSWAKNPTDAAKSANQTLNARGETIFEKASFKSSAKSKRCLIFLDAFYEHHHYKGNTYPFRIEMKDKEPFAVAGLWNDWTNKETGEIINTISIVTTEANPLMTKIHNNPKADGARMPVILSKETQDAWLAACNSENDINYINELIKPIDEELLQAHTVGRLKGKAAIGNVVEVEKEVIYPELSF